MTTNDFLTAINTLAAFFIGAMTIINSRQLKSLDIRSAEMNTKLQIHYSDKLSPIREFLLAAGEFSSKPESEEAFQKMLALSGIAIYVSSNPSKKSILDFIDYSMRLKNKADNNLVNPVSEYMRLCTFLGQETVELDEQSCTAEII